MGTVIIGYITNYVVFVSKSPIEHVIFFMGCFLLVILFVAFFLYYRDQNLQDYKIKFYDSLTRDVISLYHHKKIYFGDEFFSIEKMAKVIEYRAIQNNMGNQYNLLTFEIISKTSLPKRISFFKDGELIFIPEKNIQLFDIINVNDSTDKKQKISYNVPLDIDDGNICKLKTVYYTSAYQRATDSEFYDYTLVYVDRIVKQLKIELILTERMSFCYKFEHITDPEKIFNILDVGNERMWKSESVMRKNSNKPQYNESKITWIIQSPKMGYRYKLFFKIVKKTDIEVNSIINELKHSLCPPIINNDYYLKYMHMDNRF